MSVAVVLFNLGGPDRLEAVAPFLFNLFNNSAIIGAPPGIRWLLAKFISSRRAPVAREIYGKIGGGSPILANTEAQARALEAELARQHPNEAWRVFVAMRYWHPFIDETVAAVRAMAPSKTVLLPLYPQFSTTTTASSIGAWRKAARAAGLGEAAGTLCCYPDHAGFAAAIEDLLRRALVAAPDRPWRVLFSAHGLPKKIVARGDPYSWQVQRTAAAVARAMDGTIGDWVVCYQSRVGPLAWIGPSTEDEIKRAGRERVPLMVVPIAFVSEHSETLVELDIEYRKLAETCGVPDYVRVPTVGAHPAFIAGLAALAAQAAGFGGATCSAGGKRICPAEHGRCAMAG